MFKQRNWIKRYQQIWYLLGVLGYVLWLCDRYGDGIIVIQLLIFTIVLVWGATIDKRYYILPDEGAILLGLVGLLYSYGQGRWLAITGLMSLVIMLLCYLLRILSRGGFGWGHIKWFGALALWQTVEGVWLMFGLSFIIGTLYLIYQYACSTKSIILSQRVPFGPFLCLSAYITVLC